MSVIFNSVGEWEKLYPFEDAVVNAETLNGCFGTVTAGVFEPAANAMKCVMQVEVGDDAGLDEYKIPASSHVRVCDLTKVADYALPYVRVFGAQLPATFAVGDKFVSDASGKLITGSVAPYLEVTEVIGNKVGIVAKIVTA